MDLSTPRGNMITLARLVGDLDVGQQKAGWYNGYVCGVRPGEAVRDLFGFAGFGMARLRRTKAASAIARSCAKSAFTTTSRRRSRSSSG